MSPVTVSFISAIVISMISMATSFNCYQCNSADSPECADLHAHPPHNVSVFHKPCIGDYGDSQPFCRKIIYKFKFLRNADVAANRVVRTCGHERSKMNCYNADNDHHFETVCQCFNDGCNGADNLPIFHFFSILIMTTIAYYLL